MSKKKPIEATKRTTDPAPMESVTYTLPWSEMDAETIELRDVHEAAEDDCIAIKQGSSNEVLLPRAFVKKFATLLVDFEEQIP